ncbi:MAG: hypothetical protein Kow0074_16320 [Candidatus Zixiibacteriota bacterium]
MIDVSAGSGVALPTGLAGDFYDSDVLFQGAVTVADDRRAIRGRLKLQYFKLDRAGFIIGPSSTSGFFKVTGGTADLVYAPPLKGPFRPYGFFGFGFYFVTVRWDDEVTRTHEQESDTHGAYDLGVGAEMLWGRMGLYGEASYLEFTSAGSWSQWNIGIGATVRVY